MKKFLCIIWFLTTLVLVLPRCGHSQNCVQKNAKEAFLEKIGCAADFDFFKREAGLYTSKNGSLTNSDKSAVDYISHSSLNAYQPLLTQAEIKQLAAYLEARHHQSGCPHG